MKSILAGLPLLFFFVGCSSTDFDAYFNSENLPPGSFAKPQNGQKALVIEPRQLKNAIDRHLAAGYVVIGTMQLTSERIPNSDIAAYARKKGASVVLASIAHSSTANYSGLEPVYKTLTADTYGSYAGRYYGSTTNMHYLDYEKTNYTVFYYDHLYIFLSKKVA